jgi:hypothetical protein
MLGTGIDGAPAASTVPEGNLGEKTKRTLEIAAVAPQQAAAADYVL